MTDSHNLHNTFRGFMVCKLDTGLCLEINRNMTEQLWFRREEKKSPDRRENLTLPEKLHRSINTNNQLKKIYALF